MKHSWNFFTKVISGRFINIMCYVGGCTNDKALLLFISLLLGHRRQVRGRGGDTTRRKINLICNNNSVTNVNFWKLFNTDNSNKLKERY